MLSSREHNSSSSGLRSARKYAVPVPYASSPLARDSTAIHTLPMRSKRNQSFSTSNHTHGLGGEAKEAMLRSGLKMKRTGSSLRIVATKGHAILSAAFHHSHILVPDLEVFRRVYTRKEDEFAESIHSAMSPFQFVTKDTSDLSQWQRHSKSSSTKLQPPEEEDGAQMDEWLKEMRLKVHIRLVQKQQFTNTANPIENQPSEQVEKEMESELHSPKKALSRPPSRGGEETKRKLEREDTKRKMEKAAKGELALDTLEPPPSAKRSPIKKLKEFKEKRASLPPLPHKPSQASDPEILSPTATASADKPRLPKIMSHENNSIMNTPGSPLFYQRDSIKARRTYSEQDVRRLRSKARNSVGLEPIT